MRYNVLTDNLLCVKIKLSTILEQGAGWRKVFDTMKHSIDMKRLKVYSRMLVNGLLFIEFISLIGYTEIQRVLRTTGLGKKMTVEQMFYELNKLSVIEIDEKSQCSPSHLF